MRVFKNPVTSYLAPSGSRCKKSEAMTLDSLGREVLRPGYKVVRSESPNWYGKYRDAENRPQRVALCPDKQESQRMLTKLVTDAAEGRHGLRDPFEQHRSVPLSQHLADFARELETKGGTEAHRKQMLSRLKKAFQACGFRHLEDLSGAKLGELLAERRRGGRTRVSLDPKKQCYTVREVGAILQIKPPAVRAMVQRHRLEATGKGKARRFPRATVEALQDRLCRGISVQTSNYIIMHARSFGRFLVKHSRLPENPFVHLQKGRVEVDRRHDRRELTMEDMKLLLERTRESPRVFRGLPGQDRSVLYATAASTGFRAAALASLTPENFHLDTEPATVILAARFNKNRKPRVQPPPAEIVGVLIEYLASKPRKQLLWGGTWATDHRGAR